MSPNLPANAASTATQSTLSKDIYELFDVLLQNIPDRIYFKDAQSRFIRVSQAKAERHGVSNPHDLIGKSDADLFTAEHAEQALHDEQEIMRTGKGIADKVEKETLPDGKVCWALTTKMPLRNSRGEVVGTYGISKDITALKEMEDALAKSNAELSLTIAELKQTYEALKVAQGRLIEAEKMETAARLAAGVAHEVRNPLNILNTGIEFLSADPMVSGDSTTSAVMVELREAIRRADAVICALMDSSQTANLDLKETDINALLGSVLAAREREVTKCGVKLVKEFAAGLPALQLDTKKIETVFDGILSNAIEAMCERGGELVVRTRQKELTSEDVTYDPGERSGQRSRAGDTVVLVEIEDTGLGIPEKSLHDIFDPFFTTKKTGDGVGLGLTICRKILELHRGSIEISNREEGGVRVTIRLNAA